MSHDSTIILDLARIRSLLQSALSKAARGALSTLALQNRQQTAAGGASCDAFTKQAPNQEIVAGTVIAAKASGVFVVDFSQIFALAGADEALYTLLYSVGSTVTGGTASGGWRTRVGSDVVVAGGTIPAPIAAWAATASAGNLTRTALFAQLTPGSVAPVGSNVALFVQATTIGNTAITPAVGATFASAYELP